ncbi:MAG: glycine cleavage system protein GcvH [Thermodesulfobacteriota bacterium]
MDLPEGLLFTKDHEWIRVEDGVATIGITEYAQESMGDVVYLELPDEGATLASGESFGVVESVKAVSDLFSPINGSVVEVNASLTDTPEVVNDDPYGAAWMVKVKLNSGDNMEGLFTPEEYQRYLDEEK